MSDKKEIFADGIGQIHFAGNMVRYDFVTLQPGEDGAAPTPVSTVRVIMPPRGFLTAFTSMQQLIDKLVDAGVLTRTAPAAGVKTEKKADAAPAQKTAPKGKAKSKSKK